MSPSPAVTFETDLRFPEMWGAKEVEMKVVATVCLCGLLVAAFTVVAALAWSDAAALVLKND